MARRRIGFRTTDVIDDESDLTTVETAEATLDLHDELVKAINTLIQITLYYQGNIKGITINIDNKGNYTSKIKY
ncbi:hypothetical protein JCM17380_24560 [Desulfosporosinus burensis]